MGCDEWEKFKKTVKKLNKNHNDLTIEPVKKKNIKFTYDSLVFEEQISCFKLDLHGMTANEARVAVDEFIKNSFKNRFKKITIITGHGRDDAKSILQRELPFWLEDAKIAKYISKTQKINIKKNKPGALEIFLKKNR